MLEAWLSSADIRKGMEQDGYVVLRGIFSPEECAEEVARLWRFVETVSPSVRREDPESWYPRGGGPDPWPHTRWGSFRDMFQVGKVAFAVDLE